MRKVEIYLSSGFGWGIDISLDPAENKFKELLLPRLVMKILM